MLEVSSNKLSRLRRVITESLRVQKGGPEGVPYIDVSNVIDDICAKQNHVVFARRGCGKSLLLHHSSRMLEKSKVRAVYLNCEDFKRHSFPNVLIEILDALFLELERNLTGWFGRKAKSKQVIQNIRQELSKLKDRADELKQTVRDMHAIEKSNSLDAGVKAGKSGISLSVNAQDSNTIKRELEKHYDLIQIKLEELDKVLPRLKSHIRDFFDLSNSVESVFLQIDDFYHLKRSDQPYTMDYIHRLCKDVPLFFKVATLRHATNLYADRDGQPIGAQQRHDYQPIDIDYTFGDFNRTKENNRKIFHEFGRLADMSTKEIDYLFKGVGFERLIMAGGGVPRDCLSLFVNILSDIQSRQTDNRIGKDDIRILSKSNFEQRIAELKQDSEGDEQDLLIKGISLFRKFCLDRKTNVFLVSEQLFQQNDNIRDLIYRLLDYRIIHSAGSTLTHKSQVGTYQAFAIDIGCYAHLRKLDGKFTEIDLTDEAAKDKMRSAQIFDEIAFKDIWSNIPENPLNDLLNDEETTA